MSADEPHLRRIVTGHDAAGNAVVVSDEAVQPARLDEDSSSAAAFFQVWATDRMPVSLSEEALAAQRSGSASTTVGTGGGTAFRIGVLPPGLRSPMHRTESIDYAICLEGECDLELDGGQVVRIHAGDVVIQRGTKHVWHNRSTAPCRFAWILIDALPATVAGRQLGTSWERDDSRSGAAEAPDRG